LKPAIRKHSKLRKTGLQEEIDQESSLPKKTQRLLALLRKWRTNSDSYSYNQAAYEFLIKGLKEERE